MNGDKVGFCHIDSEACYTVPFSLGPSHALHLVNQLPLLKHLLCAWYQTHIIYNLTTNLRDRYDYYPI